MKPVIKEVYIIVENYKNKSDKEKIKALPKVKKLRSALFKEFIKNKGDPNIKKALSLLGKTFPPYLSRKQKGKFSKKIKKKKK